MFDVERWTRFSKRWRRFGRQAAVHSPQTKSHQPTGDAAYGGSERLWCPRPSPCRLMVVSAQSGTNSDKNLERDGIASVGGIERCGLRVEGKVTAHCQAPESGLDEVARAPKSVGSYAEAR